MADEGSGRGTSVHSGAYRRTGSPPHLGPPSEILVASVLVHRKRRAEVLEPRVSSSASAVRTSGIRSHLEKHLSTILEELEWKRVAAHPGTWVHKKTKALLAVYVDDLLITASSSHEKDLWKALEERINFDDEPAKLAQFLGAHH